MDFLAPGATRVAKVSQVILMGNQVDSPGPRLIEVLLQAVILPTANQSCLSSLGV